MEKIKTKSKSRLIVFLCFMIVLAIIGYINGWHLWLIEAVKTNLITENRYLLVLRGLGATLLISVCAAVFGTVLGGFICAIRMSGKQSLVTISKVYINIIRGIPVVIILMLFFFVAFVKYDINPIFVAVLSFSIYFSGYVAEIFRTGIESVDKGQFEAGAAGGFSKAQTFIYIIFPQALRHFLPVYSGEFITMMKFTSVVGYISVEDLTRASETIKNRTFSPFFPLLVAAALYFLSAWAFISGLSFLEKRINRRIR